MLYYLYYFNTKDIEHVASCKLLGIGNVIIRDLASDHKCGIEAAYAVFNKMRSYICNHNMNIKVCHML